MFMFLHVVKHPFMKAPGTLWTLMKLLWEFQSSWELKNSTPAKLKEDDIINRTFLILVACNCRLLFFSLIDFHLNVISVHIDPKAFVCCL